MMLWVCTDCGNVRAASPDGPEGCPACGLYAGPANFERYEQ